MKARIRKTGETIDVVPKDGLYVSDNRVYRDCELDFINVENKSIDWEQRRYEKELKRNKYGRNLFYNKSFC